MTGFRLRWSARHGLQRAVWANFRTLLERLEVAGRRHWSVTTERPLIGVLRPSTREGPEWIVEAPSSVGHNSAAPDPQQPSRFSRADVQDLH